MTQIGKWGCTSKHFLIRSYDPLWELSTRSKKGRFNNQQTPTESVDMRHRITEMEGCLWSLGAFAVVTILVFSGRLQAVDAQSGFAGERL